MLPVNYLNHVKSELVLYLLDILAKSFEHFLKTESLNESLPIFPSQTVSLSNQ